MEPSAETIAETVNRIVDQYCYPLLNDIMKYQKELLKENNKSRSRMLQEMKKEYEIELNEINKEIKLLQSKDNSADIAAAIQELEQIKKQLALSFNNNVDSLQVPLTKWKNYQNINNLKCTFEFDILNFKQAMIHQCQSNWINDADVFRKVTEGCGKNLFFQILYECIKK